MDDTTRGALRDTFDRAASAYATSRPGYPVAAAGWLVGGRSLDVLDLGAGSGSLTRMLEQFASRVVAVEPSPNLLAELRLAAPGATAVRAAAEALPFKAGLFDVVTVATAFHWFDHETALPEIARVLRPGGTLSLTWNMRSGGASWTRALDDLLLAAQPPTLQGDWGTGSVRVLDDSALFGTPEYAEFPHAQAIDGPGLVDLVASRSYVIALDPAKRRRLLEDVAALFDAHVGASSTLDLPYRCQCWRFPAT
jgi:SAM-dependent methyltransferase